MPSTENIATGRTTFVDWGHDSHFDRGRANLELPFATIFAKRRRALQLDQRIMIRTVADMLARLSEREAALLAASDITHAPTIGLMYEGLTRDLLGRSVPPGLDMRVVSGFVVDGRGNTSGQIDCMLVRGVGKPVPHVANTYQWHVRDVIAVFEVKKTLFGGQLAEAYGQLARVGRVYSSWIQHVADNSSVGAQPSLKAYADITGEVAPSPDDWPTMDTARHLILHTILRDQLAPISIMLGYEGYGSELTLRRGFLDFIDKNIGVSGFGPVDLPSLIVAGGNSLIKMSGHPYLVPLQPDGRWVIMTSSHANPLNLMLELIWTRLSYDFSITPLFGDDLDTEQVSLLLAAEPGPNPARTGEWGWKYYATEVSAKTLGGEAIVDWSPVEIDTDQQFILTLALGPDPVLRDDPDAIAWLRDQGRDPEQFWADLLATRLVAFDGNRLVVTARDLTMITMNDGRTVAGENNTGRLSRWMARRFDADDQPARDQSGLAQQEPT